MISDLLLRKFNALKICVIGDGIKVINDDFYMGCSYLRDNRVKIETLSAKMVQ